MGAFFTNIQLSISNLDKAKITNQVIEYITHCNEEVGYRKVDNVEDADKSVIISMSQNSEWLSIYDEELEDQDSKKLNTLSSDLSKQFNTTALSILVNDSESMYVGLTVNGVLKDTISNLSNEIDFNKNKPTVWTTHLLNNYSFEDLKNAWQNKSVFVEEFLIELSKYIHLDHSKLLTGYYYTAKENTIEGIKLNFAKGDKLKSAELGLTKFSMLAGAGLIDVKEGEKQHIDWTLTNLGTSSKGVEIIITGECIEKGLLLPEIVQTKYIRQQLDKPKKYLTTFEETVATTGEKLFYARIEDIYIPKGFQPNYSISTKEEKKYRKLAYDCAIEFTICFVGGNPGGGEVAIFFSPIENRQEGSYYTILTKGTLEEWIKKNGF